MDGDFIDYIGYKIYKGEGHEFGWGDPPEEEIDLEIYERISEILKPLEEFRWDD